MWVAVWSATEDDDWIDGYDTGHEHGSAGMPNMLDVRGRRMAEVIPLRPEPSQTSPATSGPDGYEIFGSPFA